MGYYYNWFARLFVGERGALQSGRAVQLAEGTASDSRVDDEVAGAEGAEGDDGVEDDRHCPILLDHHLHSLRVADPLARRRRGSATSADRSCGIPSRRRRPFAATLLQRRLLGERAGKRKRRPEQSTAECQTAAVTRSRSHS